MVTEKRDYELSDEDLRSALREVKTYVDITEEDLRKIYSIALKHARERISLRVLVSDVMTTDVTVVRKYDDVNEAARLLSEHKISGLPVVDKENIVIGVITEADILSMIGIKEGHSFRDILRHILGEPLPERKAGHIVGDVMTTPALTTGPGVDIREVAKILDEKRIKRLPVVDKENRLLGIISRADIVRAMSK